MPHFNLESTMSPHNQTALNMAEGNQMILNHMKSQQNLASIQEYSRMAIQRLLDGSQFLFANSNTGSSDREHAPEIEAKN